METGREWYSGVPAEAGLNDSERRELRLFEILCRHFAYLERVVTGEVSFDLPNYAALDLSVFEGTMQEQGIGLAVRERDRLDLGRDPIVGMKDMLDGMGIKVIARPMPKESDVNSGFLFSSDIGPCIMLSSSRSVAEQTLAMAHQYGHFLMDFDPYLPRVCMNGISSEEDFSEDRARSFAFEFLVPGDSLLTLLGHRGRDGLTESDLDALAVYFGVTRSAVVVQLVRLGLQAAGEGREEEWDGRETSMEGTADLPERFVRLAVEARSRGLISDLRVARLLQVAPGVVEELVSLFSAGETPHECDDVPGDEA